MQPGAALDQRTIARVPLLVGARIVGVFAPIAVFWALFFQYGSSWVLQAREMSPAVLGLQVVPEQIQVLNAVFVLLLIPIFSRVLYPAVERGGRFHYSESFVDRLCTEWMTRAEAMRLMGIASQTAFRNRARNHGIGTLVIGHASLARSADLLRSLRRRGE